MTMPTVVSRHNEIDSRTSRSEVPIDCRAMPSVVSFLAGLTSATDRCRGAGQTRSTVVQLGFC